MKVNVRALVMGQHPPAKVRAPTSASQTASTTKPATANTDVSSANANLTRKGIAEIANARSRDLISAAIEQAKMARS